MNRVPSPEQRERTVDDEGNFSEHVQLFSEHETYQLWMHKIGPYLADWVLGKSRYDSPQWKLVKFPEGYTLWLHRTGVQTDPANPRIDAYLHGAPHLGSTAGRTLSQAPAPTVFRSPMEFVEHAIWLMRAGAGQCRCKYCIPGQNQLDINRRLNRGSPDDEDVIVVDGDDSPGGSGGGDGGAGAGSSADDGAGGAGGTSGTGSASSSRPRGRGTRGRRARRDRPAPILAKDYRVGNNSPAPGPA